MSVQFKPCHDRAEVELSTPDDVVVINIPRAEEMVVELLNAISVVKGRKHPPAPEPLWTKDIGHEGAKGCGDYFAQVGECKISDPQYHPYFSLGGFELGIEDVEKIHDWLGKAIKYVRS